jgi:hypothetical protein
MMQQPMHGGGMIRIRHRIMAVLANIAIVSVPRVLPYVATAIFAFAALSRLTEDSAAKPARCSW